MSAEQVAVALGLQSFAFLVTGGLTLLCTQGEYAPLSLPRAGFWAGVTLLVIGVVSGVGFIWAGAASGLIQP